MAEVTVASLDPRHQTLVEKARVALDRGNFDYVREVTAQVLKAAPGCLPVRRLQRVAQLRGACGKGGRLRARIFSGFVAATFWFGAARKDPARALKTAEALLERDPHSVAALRLLADAAARLGLHETQAFALDAVRDLQPDNRANLLALGEAWLAAGRPDDALEVADRIFRANPADAGAQRLMHDASVAQTVSRGNWQPETSYRAKLRDEEQTVLLERSAKFVAGDLTPGQLLEQALTRVAEEPLNPTHYHSAARACRQLGRLDEALAWIRRARQQAAGSADPAFEKEEGELLFELGQIDGAIAQFQQAQRGPRVRVASLIGLGRCFKAKKLHDLAVAQFNAARSELGAMDDVKKDVVYELGACFELMGKPDEAIAEYKAIYSEDIGFRDVADKINAYYSKT